MQDLSRTGITSCLCILWSTVHHDRTHICRKKNCSRLMPWPNSTCNWLALYNIMPPRQNTPQNKSNSHWKPADDVKLLNLVKQGQVDPEDRSLAAIKRLHAEEWPQKTYKSFARLIRPKLEKLHTARVIEGARKTQSRIEQEGKMSWFVDCF